MTNILFLGSHNSEMINFLCKLGDQVISCEEKVTADSHLIKHIDFIVSYGYRHILKWDILEKFQQRAINIHISLLPWNRGADPNLWSFLENTPKGVSIHYIDIGIDTGDILVQREVNFSMDETLKTSYEKLSYTAENLFKEYWLDIRNNKIKPSVQNMIGSFHLKKDRSRYDYLLVTGWDTPVSEITGKALF
jgi:methionyl-tRNA formyltransferase